MRGRADQGFTLVEVMIVVAIIALLAAIAIPNVLRGRMTANEAAQIGNIRALSASLEMYRSSNSAYPATGAFRTALYGTDCVAATAPNPDFGPPSFCNTAADDIRDIQGYNYQWVGGATSYSILTEPVTVNDGGRSFLVDQTGLVRHCSGGALGAATAGNMAAANTLDQAPTSPCT